MSRPLRYTDFAAQPAQTQDVSRPLSDSTGVDFWIQGWEPGLNKVALTRFLRDGGLPLHEASRITGRVLGGERVHVTLPLLTSRENTVAALQGIGVKIVLDSRD